MVKKKESKLNKVGVLGFNNLKTLNYKTTFIKIKM
tara:strand:- start:938 stop:1042 length:105 start_codon:yes stop_codon:yes gene_type:complete